MRFRWLLWICIWPFFCPGFCPGFCSEFEVSESDERQEDEALFLRRISEFWQEGEFQIAKNQIEEFIIEYPQSRYSDPLCAALGDLYLREKNVSQALSHYAKVQSAEYAGKVFLSRMQCLYEMQWYATLADECESYLQKPESSDPAERLHATYFLAVALYQQCLNTSKEPDALVQLAKRAQPYFQILFESELSDEVAQSFAHLCCILKDFEKASRIYQDLAKDLARDRADDPAASEEMLFQAALVQAEYDKKLALESFESLAKKGGKRGKEASYNRLVLAFETGLYEELALAKEAIFAEMPEEKVDVARLFFGRSLVSLKKYPEAVEELTLFIRKADPGSDSFDPALLSLLEAAYQAGDLSALDFAIEKLPLLKLQRPEEMPKALFSRAQVLKRNQRVDEAQGQLEKLVGQFSKFPERAQALFELSHLSHNKKNWISSRRWAQLFLAEFPHHELSPFAWRYLATSSSEIAAASADPASREQLALDIESLLQFKDYFPKSERTEWQLLYVKTLIQLGTYEKAAALLHGFLDSKNEMDLLGKQEANAWLLLALCYRDGSHDLEKFCEAAEIALSKKPDLLDQGQIHLFLFNAYLERSSSHPEFMKKGADHLYSAFQRNAPIQSQNLHWLADFYFSQSLGLDRDLSFAEKTAALLEHLIHPSDFVLTEQTLPLEAAVFKLAQTYDILGLHDKEISLLEKTKEAYRTTPQLKFIRKNEILLQLGTAYFHKGEKDKALSHFDAIVSSSGTLRTSAAASACLHRAKIHLSSLEELNIDSQEMDLRVAKIASELKNLVLQKRLANEPSHLEAALEYIDLQTRFEKEPVQMSQKRISLLQKTKTDFEKSDDLLSKDYHEARVHFPQKNQIYEAYLRFVEADLFLTQAQLTIEPELQKELQANGKDLLLKLIEEKAHPLLVDRAQKRLNSAK